MGLVERLHNVKLRDLAVPAAGVVAMFGSMYGGVVGGEVACNYFCNKEAIGAGQVVGNLVGGGVILIPTYAVDCFFRYRGQKATQFFKDQTKLLGVVLSVGSVLNVAKPFISGGMMRCGLSQGESSFYYDIGANAIRLIADNAAFFNNVTNLRAKKQ